MLLKGSVYKSDAYNYNVNAYGPVRTGQIFVYFAKKSFTSFLRQVRPMIFRFLDLPNFIKASITSKRPSSCLGAGQIFVRREI